jgi:ATP-binding cassette, subfamily B, bacterial
MATDSAIRGFDLRRLHRALRLVWQSARAWTLVNLVLVVVQSVLPLVGLYLLKLVVDAISVGMVAGAGGEAEGFDRVLLLIGLTALVTVVGLLARALGSFATEAQAALVTDHMLDRLHAKAVAVDYAYYEDSRYYNTLHRAQQEAPSRPTRLLSNLTQFGQSAITSVGILILLVAVHWALAGLIVLAVIPALLVKVRHSRRLHHWHRDRSPTERKASYLEWVIGHPMHAKEVRTFGLGAFLRDRFRELRAQLRREKLRLARARSTADAGAQMAASVVVFGSLAFVAHQTYLGILTLGDMVMYFGAIQRGQSAIQALFSALANLYEDNLFLSMVDEFLELEPALIAPAQPRPVPRPIRRGLVCEGVHFGYPVSSRNVLEDINMEVRPGEIVALVGPNGSGKTTLVKLLCRLYDPASGRVTLDGIDLRDFDPAELRKQLSVVFQDYGRYHMPARENIWFGDIHRAASPDRIRDAARIAGAHTAIERLPNGYDTMLGRMFPGGEELSIGEWQKVALARAFLSEGEILIVDEPTSSLDASAEAEVFEALRELVHGRAAIVIGHRLSTVRMANRIYFLDAGRIVEEGTHDELMRRQGMYARLFGVQAAMYRGEAVPAGTAPGKGVPGGVDRGFSRTIRHDR